MSITDTIALLALIFSIISGVLVIRISFGDTRLAAYDRATDLFLEIDRSFLGHPELRAFFYNNASLAPDDPLCALIDAQAELMLDVFDWNLRRRRRVGKADMGGWQAYMLDALATGTVLSAYHEAHREWHPYVDHLIRSQPVSQVGVSGQDAITASP